MFIRRVKKKNGVTGKTYECLHLVESIRTPDGPRQRLVLNLGNINIHKSQFKALARRIEDILTGQASFETIDKDIDKHAKQAADKYFAKQAETKNTTSKSSFENIDINSIESSKPVSLGAEFVCNAIWNELELDKIFKSENVPANTLSIIKAMVFGRLIEPASERHTKAWAEERSSIYELIPTPMQNSLNSYYRADDVLFSLKDKLEKHLRVKEENLFSLDEKTYLFDLTNTYFEGEAKNNPKAKRGHSKEKRSDCKLETLGLIVDAQGFPKYSKLFPGNQVEGATLIEMIKGIACPKVKSRP